MLWFHGGQKAENYSLIFHISVYTPRLELQLLPLEPTPCPPAARPRLSRALPWALTLLQPVGVCSPAPAPGEVKQPHGMDSAPWSFPQATQIWHCP